jgi:hypothetical protein
MTYLGSVTWDYFDNEREARNWDYDLNKKGISSKYLGEKNGRFIVQKSLEDPYKEMERIEQREAITNRRIF